MDNLMYAVLVDGVEAARYPSAFGPEGVMLRFFREKRVRRWNRLPAPEGAARASTADLTDVVGRSMVVARPVGPA